MINANHKTARYAFISLMGLCALVGCAEKKQPTTRPSTAYERSQQALQDPFNYSPDMGDHDVSGGGIGDLDRDALQKDVDHVLDP